MPIRAVVCDLDGLLIDTEVIFQEASRQVLALRGVPHDPLFLGQIMGMPGRDALPRFQQYYGLADPLDAIAADYTTAFYTVLASEVAPLRPGVYTLLDELDARRLPRGIATSSSREYVGRVFAPHGLIGRFAFALTCDDVTHGKPHPEIYLKACDRLGVRPDEVVVLEDSANGLDAAKAAGCACIVVPHEHTPMGRIGAADAVVPALDAAELFAWLDAGVRP